MNLRNTQRVSVGNLVVAACLTLGSVGVTLAPGVWAQAVGKAATPPKASAASAKPASTSQGAQSAPEAVAPAKTASKGDPAKPETGMPSVGATGAQAAGPQARTKPAAASAPAVGTATPGVGSPVAAPSPPSKPASAANPAAAPATASGSAPLDAATYAVRLRDLESRVDELKEQIRRSHTRLSLLSDTVLSGGIGGAEANVQFENQLTNAYRVNKVIVVLDGAVQYKKQDDTGELSSQKLIPMFSGAVPPGDHTLQVVVGIQGHGYGVFSYLRGYTFEAKNTHSFTVSEGKSIKLDIIVTERGGATTPIEERPTIRFTEKVIGRTEAGGASE